MFRWEGHRRVWHEGKPRLPCVGPVLTAAHPPNRPTTLQCSKPCYGIVLRTVAHAGRGVLHCFLAPSGGYVPTFAVGAFKIVARGARARPSRVLGGLRFATSMTSVCACMTLHTVRCPTSRDPPSWCTWGVPCTRCAPACCRDWRPQRSTLGRRSWLSAAGAEQVPAAGAMNDMVDCTI